MITGIVFLFIAISFAGWAWKTGSTWLWIAGGAAAFCGSFCIFEARAGWCAVRAMGFKTKV
jgi:hypothetical protein